MKPLTRPLLTCMLLIALAAGHCGQATDLGPLAVQNGGVGDESRQEMEAMRS